MCSRCINSSYVCFLLLAAIASSFQLSALQDGTTEVVRGKTDRAQPRRGRLLDPVYHGLVLVKDILVLLTQRFLMNKTEALMRIMLIRVEALMNNIEALMLVNVHMETYAHLRVRPSPFFNRLIV